MPSQSRRRFGKLLVADETSCGGSGPVPASQPFGITETVAYGAGDSVQDGLSGRSGMIQMSYIDGRTVLYSVCWEDGTTSSKKTSELRLLKRKSPS
jgi:hypothetical protein